MFTRVGQTLQGLADISPVHGPEHHLGYGARRHQRALLGKTASKRAGLLSMAETNVVTRLHNLRSQRLADRAAPGAW